MNVLLECQYVVTTATAPTFLGLICVTVLQATIKTTLVTVQVRPILI